MAVEEKEYASKSTAGTALGLSIPGVVAFLNQMSGCNGGFLNGIFGGNKNCENYVDRYELTQSQTIAILQSEKTTDNKIIEAYRQSVADNKILSDKIVSNNETIYKELVAQREQQLITNAKFEKDIALNKQAGDYNYLLTNKEINTTNVKVNCLQDRLDVLTKEIIPLSNICPQPLAACVPVGFPGQSIDTSTVRNTETSINTLSTSLLKK